ncbi:hypothetical protein [Proteus phage 2]|nr:hypothetical protein [Proteus phage 1]QNN97944.1 hypothetical protein [Proteus phage 2]
MKDPYYNFSKSDIFEALVHTSALSIYIACTSEDYKYNRFIILDFVSNDGLLELFQEIDGRFDYNTVMSVLLHRVFCYMLDQGLNVKLDTGNTWGAHAILFPSLMSKESKWIFPCEYNLYSE